MKRIFEGIARFQNEVYPEHRELFQDLARQQKPEVLLITCSDSRVVPDLIVQAKPGDIFVCRNAGNIAPSYGEVIGGVSATIEYAVLALGVKDVIVCGHSDCGAMRGLLDPSKVASMPTVAKWLSFAERAATVVRHNYSHLSEQQRLEALIEENVLAQLDNLRTHPSVAAQLRKGALRLHGWVYEIESGRIRAFDESAQKFVPLDTNAAIQHHETAEQPSLVSQ